MTARRMTEWQRLEYESIPIYVRPQVPDWFVPNQPADRAFTKLWSSEGASPEIRHLLRRIDGPTAPEYQSRSDQLQLDGLKECWLHITNRCNMACRHCMFASSPGSRDELTQDDVEKIVRQAYGLGCRLFFFTGGEPFLSKAFLKSLHDILQLAHTHVVVLTNLSLISQVKEQIRSLPRDRLHFQASLDGLQSNHDALRGSHAFHRLSKDLVILRELGFPVTLSTTVTRRNVAEMEQIIDFAAQQQVSDVHFLWLFRKGNADDTLFVAPDQIFSHLTAAQERAEEAGVRIDNIESLRSQVFSSPGTRYDLSNAGWQSIAVGPDGCVYPTPALIYTKDMQCGHIREGLKEIWEKSPVLRTVRNASLNDSSAYRANSLRYIIGGGDIDHSYIHSGKVTGGDPYVGLYANIAKWLIVHEAGNYPATDSYPAIRLKMGEKLGECPVEGGTVFFTHSNCVLSLPGHDTRSQVNHFYTQAAEETKEDILNPICYEEDLIRHIPEEMRYRSYGCGSPVLEAHVRPNETVVDLGSGTGIECFIAGKLTGYRGKVIGIDMGDAMLAVANKTKVSVVNNLGYDNVEFKKAFLEDLPLDHRSADLVISNCVLNLSPDKRRVFHEIHRVLKPKGRLVISDISYDEDIPLEIKYNEKLRGECIGGALRYHDLFGLLNDLGFSKSEIIKGYHYRTVKGYDFYSITYQAYKPPEDQPPVLYTFPAFDRVIAAVEIEPTCTCFVTPEEKPQDMVSKEPHPSGCMVCGEELVYFETYRDKACHYCGQVLPANAQCADGHFVCDRCHRADGVEIIKQVCLHSKEPDAFALMEAIRSHSRFPVHGPEHHALVPAVILTALRNAGTDITDEQIITAIQRGQSIAGGACAFLGACGAAVGVGTAFSVLLGANPYQGDKRQAVQQVTQEVLQKIASYEAPRCCQRDCWLALQEASRLLKERLGLTLTLNEAVTCGQFSRNKECIHERCPFWPRRQK